MKTLEPFNFQSKSSALCMITALYEDRRAVKAEGVQQRLSKDADLLALAELRKYIGNGGSPAQVAQLLQTLEKCADLLLRMTTTKGLDQEVHDLCNGIVGLVELYRSR